jgi:hypothetical protein
MGVAASRAWATKAAGNLTDAKEEGDTVLTPIQY